MPFSAKYLRAQTGFSLIELLIVVAIIGILAAVGAPILHDARVSSNRAAAIANMRLLYTAEHNYFMQKGRYANLSELNSFQGGGLGTMSSSTDLFSNGYTYVMVPPSPSVTSLSTEFTIESNGFNSNGTAVKLMVSTNGTLQQVLPTSRYLLKFD